MEEHKKACMQWQKVKPWDVAFQALQLWCNRQQESSEGPGSLWSAPVPTIENQALNGKSGVNADACIVAAGDAKHEHLAQSLHSLFSDCKTNHEAWSFSCVCVCAYKPKLSDNQHHKKREWWFGLVAFSEPTREWITAAWNACSVNKQCFQLPIHLHYSGRDHCCPIHFLHCIPRVSNTWLTGPKDFGHCSGSASPGTLLVKHFFSFPFVCHTPLLLFMVLQWPVAHHVWRYFWWNCGAAVYLHINSCSESLLDVTH